MSQLPNLRFVSNAVTEKLEGSLLWAFPVVFHHLAYQGDVSFDAFL